MRLASISMDSLRSGRNAKSGKVNHTRVRVSWFTRTCLNVVNHVTQHKRQPRILVQGAYVEAAIIFLRFEKILRFVNMIWKLIGLMRCITGGNARSANLVEKRTQT